MRHEWAEAASIGDLLLPASRIQKGVLRERAARELVPSDA
jgi:hypothetical protein